MCKQRMLDEPVNAHSLARAIAACTRNDVDQGSGQARELDMHGLCS